MSGHGSGDHGANYVGYLSFGDGALDNSCPAAGLAIPKLARLEVSGTPLSEQAHEYVIRTAKTDAQD